jgi:hypothetical protein
MKHTPGPWDAWHRHINGRLNDDEIDGLGWNIDGPPKPMRGQFSLAAYEYLFLICKHTGDARLVAAAPDLLAAAQEMVKQNYNSIGAQKLRDAIAKAVGDE